jgi:hypothetical protein
MDREGGIMPAQSAPPSRGRPPGPSLLREAVAILERNAFSALRGPNSRGAVPRGAFEGIDVSTVDRSVKRTFGGASGRTPFDLAALHLCNVDGPTSGTLQAVFEAVEKSFRETDEMEITLRVFLRANFIEACNEEGVLAIGIITAAACAHLERGPEQESDQTVAAREIIEMRRQLYGELINGYAAGLAIALRRLRRRPKATVSIPDIVVAVLATSDGFVLLHKLQPLLLDPELVVETQWNVIWGLTESGLLDPPHGSRSSERRMVEVAIGRFRSSQVPSIDELASQCEVPVAEAHELFPTDSALAQRCMDYAVGSSVETEAIAVNVKGAELAAVRDLLIATTQQATEAPLLVEALRRHMDAGFCAEARRHIAEALSQSEAMNLDRSTADGVALMLLDAALQGSSGQRVWEAGLDAFVVKT